MTNKDRVPAESENQPKSTPLEQPQTTQVKPETEPEREIWEMTKEEYLNWCHNQGLFDGKDPSQAALLEEAISYHRDSIATQLEGDPNSVPKNVLEEYNRLSEKRPKQLDAETDVPKNPSAKKPESLAKTEPSLEDELKDPQFQKAVDLIVRGASKLKNNKAGGQEREYININNLSLFARAMGIKPTEAKILLKRLEEAGIVSRDKEAGELKSLWNKDRLLEAIAETRGSKRAKKSTLQETLKSKDPYIQSIALLLAESRKGKPFSQKGLLERELGLKRDEVDTIFARLTSNGLIQKDGARTVLNSQAMADYLKNLPIQEEAAASAAPASEVSLAETLNPEGVPSSNTPHSKKQTTSEKPYNPEDPLSRWNTENPFSQQPPPTPAEAELRDNYPEATHVAPPPTAPEITTPPAEITPKKEAPESSVAEIYLYFKKLTGTLDKFLNRRIVARSQLSRLNSMPLNPDINKSLDVKFDTLSATIYQLTDKELAIGKSLHTAGNRFDKGEITREEYQTEAQRILDQARQEIDPLLEKAEQEMKAIEAKINSLPQPDENPVEAGIAAADRAAEAEIDKSENPTGARKWIKMARRHFLPITLTVLVSGMGELGYFIYKGYKNQGEKGTPAEIQKETKNTAPTPKIPTPEEIVLRKEADSLKAEIAQNRVQDSINHPEEFISAQEETPISNPTAENQDQTIDQTAIAREQMAQAMNHSRVESSPPLRDNASRKTPKATETEEIGLTNREIKEALQNDIARLKAQLAKHKIAAPTSANESKAETEGLTTEHSARLNKILNQAGMSSDEYARLINETDKNGEHWTVDKFLQKYSGLNGLISIGDTYADTRAATHRNNLAEIISRVLVDQKTKDFVKHMTLGELFMYLQSIGQ